MTTDDHAILNGVIDEMRERYPGALIKAWGDSPGVICVVYREIYNEREPRVLGLRRTLESGIAVGPLVDEIVNREIGEPIGSLEAELVEDVNGVWWFQGNPPEWKVY